jgi:hypothetical protein
VPVAVESHLDLGKLVAPGVLSLSSTAAETTT